MPHSFDISLVIPTHNDGELLERCLASIAAQTLVPHEVIVVDDGSTAPESLAGIESAMRRFPGTILIRQANSGPSAARNRGLAEATGTFLAFVDADDELLPDNLMVKSALMENAPDVVAAFAGIELVEPDGRIHHSRFRNYRGPLDAGLVGKPDGVPGFLWAYLFRRDSLRAIGGLDENLQIMEDFDALVRLGRTGRAFAGCNRVVYVQHRRLGSLARASAWRQARGALRFLSKARKSRYFSAGELVRRYLWVPYSALKVVIRYSGRG